MELTNAIASLLIFPSCNKKMFIYPMDWSLYLWPIPSTEMLNVISDGFSSHNWESFHGTSIHSLIQFTCRTIYTFIINLIKIWCFLYLFFLHFFPLSIPCFFKEKKCKKKIQQTFNLWLVVMYSNFIISL